MRLERDDEKLLIEAVQKKGGLCLKLNPSWYRGIPDRLVLLPGGKIHFLELKKDKANTKRKTKVHQDNWVKILSKIGFPCDKVIGKQGVERWINENLE